MESSSSSLQASIENTSQDFPSLSDAQDYVLSLLPIPASLLSIFGSVCIIRMNFQTQNNKSKKRTPYNRLLIAMSVCDIIYSITLAGSIFLMPQDTSHRILASGNDETCTLAGFLMQFSNATIIYNTMLSFYFLCIARFGISNEKISKCIEPFMHILSIGYPLITGLFGAFMGVYSEPELSNACWVNNYPEKCGTVLLDGPGASGEACISPKIAWAFAGMWYIVALFSLAGNNVVICIHVWRQTRSRPARKSPTELKAAAEAELGVVNDDDDESYSLESSSLHLDNHEKPNTGGGSGASVAPLEMDRVPQEGDTQLARLKLVRSQALLFVGSYLLCMLWTVTLRLVEAYAGSYEDKLAANNYVLLVLQAWFLPLQGLLNMFVYIRPKFLKRRQLNPNERMFESMMISVLGETKPMVAEGAIDTGARVASKRPTANTPRTKTSEQNKDPLFARLKRSFMSSITASQGDFVENVDDKERWGAPEVLQEAMGAPQRYSSNKGTGSSSCLDIQDSSGDLTSKNRRSSSNSFSATQTSLASFSKSPLPVDRMKSVAQRCRSGGHDSPIKFPHRQESKHQRDGVVMEEDLSAGDNDANRWGPINRISDDEGLPSSPRRCSSDMAFNMEDLPAIDEVGENRKSSGSRSTSDNNDSFEIRHDSSAKPSIKKLNANMDRWQLLEPPLEITAGLDKPTRLISDDELVLVEESEEIVDESTEMIDQSEEMASSQEADPRRSKHNSISMTGSLSVAKDPEVSESSDMWSSELKPPFVNRRPLDNMRPPLVDRLAVSEQSISAQSYCSNRTSASLDVALKLPMRVASEADEMDSVS
ncbi:unnamed protein product [Cylindrotheca closterium]|uniref:Uncharacterized protein n=1 Tax=Cylindrotheca closterium TaxID=2856 RepID=A0AAD2JIN9_9STRA|nr:unnamed protein product [Cylindrotheca closterium]